MLSRRFTKIVLKFMTVMALSTSLGACKTSRPSDLVITPGSIWVSGQPATATQGINTPTLSYAIPPTRLPGSPMLTPTPDAAHFQMGAARTPETYIVQSGDWLSSIAQEHGVSVETLAQVNNIVDLNDLKVGETLTIPVVPPQPTGPGNKIIPDSELVYGPLSGQFDIDAFIHEKHGYLPNYTDVVNGDTLNASQVIQSAAQDFSINPRILLALLEYRAGWVTNPNPDPSLGELPFGVLDGLHVGLYRQLVWVAATLNDGFFRWRSGANTDWVLADGSVVPVDPTINAGTAGMQNFFAKLDDYSTWLRDVSPDGFFDTYYSLFGYPFDVAIEPLIPINLVQPALLLPFGPGETWSFTGGPHLAWDAYTPFGALDFAPPGEAQGCVEVDYWVTAVADGLVTRTGNGEVIQDLDGDGNEGSGWVILYMHIESRDRVQPGTYLRAGDRVGHPSCEGGQSSGTHVHLARKFNGEWISAIGPVPFNLSGWISAGTGEQYVGTLSRNGQVVENFEGTSPINQVQR
jgi:murein DD-endopeptidase MepM/ murein hydrolase activator NlpD